jgi:hypothetical protein
MNRPNEENRPMSDYDDAHYEEYPEHRADRPQSEREFILKLVWNYTLEENGKTVAQYSHECATAYADSIVNVINTLDRNAYPTDVDKEKAKQEYYRELIKQCSEFVEIVPRLRRADTLLTDNDEMRSLAFKDLERKTHVRSAKDEPFQEFIGYPVLPDSFINGIDRACFFYYKEIREQLDEQYPKKKAKQEFVLDESDYKYYEKPELLYRCYAEEENLFRGLWPLEPMGNRWPVAGRYQGPNFEQEWLSKGEKAWEIYYNTFDDMYGAKAAALKKAIEFERSKLDIMDKIFFKDQEATDDIKKAFLDYYGMLGSPKAFEYFGYPYEKNENGEYLYPPSDEKIEGFRSAVQNATPEAIKNAFFALAAKPYMDKWGLEEGQKPNKEQLDHANWWQKEFSRQLDVAIPGRSPDLN